MKDSNDENKFSLELFGQSFFFTTSNDKKEELIKVGNYYKNIVDSLEKKFPERAHMDILVLSGLMIADELYLLLKSRNKNFFSDIEDKIVELINSLDSILKD